MAVHPVTGCVSPPGAPSFAVFLFLFPKQTIVFISFILCGHCSVLHTWKVSSTYFLFHFFVYLLYLSICHLCLSICLSYSVIYLPIYPSSINHLSRYLIHLSLHYLSIYLSSICLCIYHLSSVIFHHLSSVCYLLNTYLPNFHLSSINVSI